MSISSVVSVLKLTFLLGASASSSELKKTSEKRDRDSWNLGRTTVTTNYYFGWKKSNIFI